MAIERPKRDQNIGVSCTEDEKAAISKAARDEGDTVSSFMRLSALAVISGKVELPDFLKDFDFSEIGIGDVTMTENKQIKAPGDAATAAAMAALVKVCESKSANNEERIAAAQVILEHDMAQARLYLSLDDDDTADSAS